MDKRSRINFVLRTILFFSCIIIFIDNPNNIHRILNYELIFHVKVYHICWIYLVNDILKVIIINTCNSLLIKKENKSKFIKGSD